MSNYKRIAVILKEYSDYLVPYPQAIREIAESGLSYFEATRLVQNLDYNLDEAFSI